MTSNDANPGLRGAGRNAPASRRADRQASRQRRAGTAWCTNWRRTRSNCTCRTTNCARPGRRGTRAARYTELFDFAPLGYFGLDRKGVVHEVNLAGARLLGCERSVLLGRPLAGFLAKESHAAFARLLTRRRRRKGAKAANSP